ncbi:MAG: hypothetical protein Q4C44_03905 [bacterium]|nr:hypothetical protein [bacterium]
MDKLNALLDKLYTNQDAMMYFYIGLGAVALLLIILIVVTSFKIKKAKKNEASVNDIKEADAGISLIEPATATTVNKTVKEEVSKEEVLEPEVKEVESTVSTAPVQTENTAEDNMFKDEPKEAVSTSNVNNGSNDNDFVTSFNVFEDKPLVSNVVQEEPILESKPAVDTVNVIEEEVPEIEMPKPAAVRQEPLVQENPVIAEPVKEPILDGGKTISELLNSDDEPNVIKDGTDELEVKQSTNDLSDLKAKLDSMRRK